MIGSLPGRLASRFVAFAFIVLIAALAIQMRPAAAKSAAYERFDVLIEVMPDGRLHVTETQVVDFQDGPFSHGYRDLPTIRTEGIRNVTVTETTSGTVPYRATTLDGLAAGPGRYNVMEVSSEVLVNWRFDPVTSGQRTFVIEYDVFGALRSYPDQSPPTQQVWWTAVSEELTSNLPVRAAKVTVKLPVAVPLSEVMIGEDGRDDPAAYTGDGRSFTWTATDLTSGDDVEVRIEFPRVVDSPVPSWQEADDARIADEERDAQHRATMQLILLAAGLLLATGGGAGVYGLWYTRGRDPHAGAAPAFLPTPPDDLSAGTVGTLLDEQANECDIVAAFLDLGHRGVIKMTEITAGVSPNRPGSDYQIEMVRDAPALPAFERELLRVAFGTATPAAGASTRLSAIGPRLAASRERLQRGLYEELVRHGYFTRSPEETRQGYRKAGIAVMVISAIAGVAGWIAIDWVALFPAAVAVIIGIALYRFSHAMPQKTAAGAEAAARWRAFRSYLTDIERYEKVTEARHIFDRYLPYAVAFGLDKTWVRKFARANVPTPSWLDTIGVPDFPHGRVDTGSWGQGTARGGGGSLDLPDLNVPDVGLPDLGKASTRTAQGIQSGSSGLVGVLNVVGAILEVAVAFSGSSKGGSSGGGGGGFR